MNKKTMIGAGVVVVAAFAGYGAMSFATKPTKPAVSVSDTPLTLAAAEGTAALAPAGAYVGTTTESGGFTGDVVEGSDDAKVTIIEYASLTCPHCASFHETAYRQLKTDYIETGKIRFIYRDFPLNDPALAATMIARCGGEEKYLGFIDLMMKQQARWTSATDLLGALKGIAKLGGLSSEQVDACLNDSVLGQNVLDRARAGTAEFEVNSTPTLVINGKRHDGGRDFASIAKAIDELL